MSDLEFAEDDVRAPGRPAPMPRPDPFRFKGSVGLGGDNFRDDVIRAQVLLGNSGDYDLAALGAPTGWPGGELWRGIRKYQKRKGLTVDGILQPVGADGVGEDGIGETVSALWDDLGTAFDGRRVPTPEEVDRHYDGPVRSDWGKENHAPQLEIALRDESGTPPHYPLGTVSDADYPSQPEWRDGAQVAQLAPPYSPPMRAVAPPGTTGSTAQSPFPHEQPEVKAAGRQLQRWFDNAGVNATRWYEAGEAAWAEGKARDPRLSDAEQAAFTHMPGDIPLPPSRPISDADQAATKTPPLVPPRVDDKLKGRPAEEQQAYIEKLIPPEMKEWYEGLEPFDQQLAGQLLIVMNRRGDETTQQGNAIFVKKYLEVFAQEFKHIRGEIKHVGGARDERGNDVKEELLRDAATGEVKGGSWADISLQFVNHITQAMEKPGDAGQRNRINTQSMQKSRPVAVADERSSLANMGRNAKGQPVAGFPKLRPDLPGGKVSDAAIEQYKKDVAEFARQNIPEWIKHLQKGGFYD